MNLNCKTRNRKVAISLMGIACLALIVILFHGCTKDDYTPDNLKFENPMDFVGQYHNKGLDYIFQNLKYSDLNLKSNQDKTEQISLLFNDFLKTTLAETVLYNSKIDYKEFGSVMSEKIIYANTNKSKSPNNQLTERQSSYVHKLKKLLYNQKKIDSLLVFNRISKLEKEIWESDMTEDEKYVVLIASSVGKYSWKFWSQKNPLKTNTPRLKGSKEDGNPEDAVWQEWVNGCLDADIEGSITGAIAGGIMGAIWGSVLLPGVGTLTAAIVEAVHGGFYGAVIGSAYYGLESLYHEFFNK